jgi:hypothetical protein
MHRNRAVVVVITYRCPHEISLTIHISIGLLVVVVMRGMRGPLTVPSTRIPTINIPPQISPSLLISIIQCIGRFCKKIDPVGICTGGRRGSISTRTAATSIVLAATTIASGDCGGDGQEVGGGDRKTEQGSDHSSWLGAMVGIIMGRVQSSNYSSFCLQHPHSLSSE